MIKNKQEIEFEAKQNSERKLEEESVKRDIENHSQVAEAVRSLFITKEKKGMWVSEVIETLQSSQSNLFQSSSDLKKIIILLTKILPRCFCFF